MVKTKDDDKNDDKRITISIGLTGSFLVVIFSLHTLLPPDTTPIYLIIRAIVYFYFALICVLFVGFLLTKAASLKYKDKNNVGVIDIFIPKGLSEFLFDFAVSYSLYSPIGATAAIHFAYTPRWLTETFSFGGIESFIITCIIYVLGFALFYIPIDYFINYKKRGYQ